MNGAHKQISEVRRLATALAKNAAACDVMICPPATLLHRLAALKAPRIMLGGQDCHAAQNGAHTGDISAEMLKDAGARAVIVGHSERRTNHAESDAVIRAKAEAAHRAGLTAIICVGENRAERRQSETLSVIRRQLSKSLPKGCTAKNTIIAYEPVWAIGTGRTPTPAQVAEVHLAMHKRLAVRFSTGKIMRLLYGGSVKADNAATLMAVPHVHGALVGGASLKASDFLKIIKTYH